MSTNFADVIIHIDEKLPLAQLKTLEDLIQKIKSEGVHAELVRL